MDTPTHPTARLDLIGLVVADMPAALAFYRRLGLHVPPGAEEQAHVETTLPGGLRLAWDTEDVVRSFEPGWTRPANGHRVGLAFDCGTPAGVDALVARLAATGVPVHLPPWDAAWGQRYAVVLDPDGGAVDLFAGLPGTPAPVTPAAG